MSSVTPITEPKGRLASPRLDRPTVRARRTRRPAEPGRLLFLAQAGDQSAFEALWARHENEIRRLCATLVRQSCDVEDAVQETAQAAWKDLPKFRGEGGAKLSTWLYRVAVNAVSAMYRKALPEPISPHSWREQSTGSDHDTDTVLRDELRTALHQIPQDFREALVLADLAGLKYREIAEIQFISEATVKTRVFRARRAMRHLLGPSQ